MMLFLMDYDQKIESRVRGLKLLSFGSVLAEYNRLAKAKSPVKLVHKRAMEEYIKEEKEEYECFMEMWGGGGGGGGRGRRLGGKVEEGPSPSSNLPPRREATHVLDPP